MAVEWAPVSLPVSRRLQTLAVIVWALVQASSVVLTVTFVLNPFTTALMLAYGPICVRVCILVDRA